MCDSLHEEQNCLMLLWPQPQIMVLLKLFIAGTKTHGMVLQRSGLDVFTINWILPNSHFWVHQACLSGQPYFPQRNSLEKEHIPGLRFLGFHLGLVFIVSMFKTLKVWSLSENHVFTNIKGRLPQKNGEMWEFWKNGGGGLSRSHFFCNLTKWFLACQIHSEVLKHVLQ